MDIMRAVSDELGMELKIEDMAFDRLFRQSQLVRSISEQQVLL